MDLTAQFGRGSIITHLRPEVVGAGEPTEVPPYRTYQVRVPRRRTNLSPSHAFCSVEQSSEPARLAIF